LSALLDERALGYERRKKGIFLTRKCASVIKNPIYYFMFLSVPIGGVEALEQQYKTFKKQQQLLLLIL